MQRSPRLVLDEAVQRRDRSHSLQLRFLRLCQLQLASGFHCFQYRPNCIYDQIWLCKLDFMNREIAHRKSTVAGQILESLQSFDASLVIPSLYQHHERFVSVRVFHPNAVCKQQKGFLITIRIVIRNI